MMIKVLATLLWFSATLISPVLDAAEQTVRGEVRGKTVSTGDVAPDFTLADQDGRKHTLSAERGKRPVVLVFYRGFW